MSEKELASKTLLELLLANVNGQDRQGQGQPPCEGEHGVPGHRAATDARALLEGLLPKPPEATPSPDQSASQDREAAVAALVSVADALTASDNLEQARGQRRSPAAATPHRTPQQDPELQLQPRKRARHGEAGPGPGPSTSTSTLTSLPALCISEPVTAALPAWLLPPVPQRQPFVPQPQPQPPTSGVYGGCVPLESLQQITQAIQDWKEGQGGAAPGCHYAVVSMDVLAAMHRAAVFAVNEARADLAHAIQHTTASATAGAESPHLSGSLPQLLQQAAQVLEVAQAAGVPSNLATAAAPRGRTAAGPAAAEPAASSAAAGTAATTGAAGGTSLGAPPAVQPKLGSSAPPLPSLPLPAGEEHTLRRQRAIVLQRMLVLAGNETSRQRMLEVARAAAAGQPDSGGAHQDPAAAAAAAALLGNGTGEEPGLAARPSSHQHQQHQRQQQWASPRQASPQPPAAFGSPATTAPLCPAPAGMGGLLLPGLQPSAQHTPARQQQQQPAAQEPQQADTGPELSASDLLLACMVAMQSSTSSVQLQPAAQVQPTAAQGPAVHAPTSTTRPPAVGQPEVHAGGPAGAGGRAAPTLGPAASGEQQAAQQQQQRWSPS